MNSPALYIFARLLVASVFIGLGAERLLIAAGVFGQVVAPISAGAVAFSIFELAAGLAIAVGWKVRWVALVMALFLLVDAFAAHPFWVVAADERHDQLLHFLKNLASIGGLLLLVWIGNPAERAVSRTEDGSTIHS